MNLIRSLNCKKGGLTKNGHDEHRDHCATMAQMVWNTVNIEPILTEADSLNSSPALQADFKINGLWEADRTEFFDKHIVNGLLCDQNWLKILRDHAHQKQNKYYHAAEDVRGHFTTFISSAECFLHNEYSRLC